MDYKKFQILATAKVCHEANRAWCEVNGDYSQKKWEDAPEWQKNSAVKGVEFRIANPDAKPSSQHEEWKKEKVNNGWVYVATKDEEKKTHPCIVDWNKLPEFQRVKDILFASIVNATFFQEF